MSTSELHANAIVIGGGLGGVATALTAAHLGHRVVLTEETDWLGGQLTSQAVPPDEHPWVEADYVSPSWRRLRSGVRDYYRRNYPLRSEAAADPLLNPGLGNVSMLCHEPRVAVAVIDELLAPFVAAGRIRVLKRHVPVAAAVEGDTVEAVTVRAIATGDEIILTGDYIVDATELGDLLELAQVEHVIGAEGSDQTGELHAPEQANPLDQQAISWCFALEHRPGEDHTIDQPTGYAHWRDHVAPFWPGPQLSWTEIHPITLEAWTRPIFVGDSDEHRLNDLWHFRRILARSQFEPGFLDSDISLVNWPQIDYSDKPLLGVDDVARRNALAGARELSLSFLHWMQTEAPRLDGGTGYRGLRLRPDVMGTVDGLAKAAYIRDARRIRAEFTVLEQHVGVDMRGAGAGSETFSDSVGLGSYRIDLHPSTAGRTYVDADSFPFQIPLGALIPQRVNNLLPANKNIGTTHITNGCYRLHPVEWSIGEAVGALIAYSLRTGLPPRKVRSAGEHLTGYQRLLTDTLGITLEWPDDVRRTSRGDYVAREKAQRT